MVSKFFDKESNFFFEGDVFFYKLKRNPNLIGGGRGGGGGEGEGGG